MNKKGSLSDIAGMSIIIVILAIMVLFGYKITDELNTEFQANSDIDSYGKQASTDLVAHYPGIIDNSFLLLAVGLGIVSVVLAAMVRVHPIFLVFYILALLILIFVCGAFSNIYEEMSLDTNLSSLADRLTVIGTIMTYLPLIVGVFGTLLAIVMYKGWRDSA